MELPLLQQNLEKQPSPALKRLQPHHRAMARLEVAFGLSGAELAQRVGLTTVMVSLIRRSDLYRAEIARLERLAEDNSLDIRKRIKSDLNILSERSVEVIAEDLYQQTPSTHRTNTAFKTLDRAGFNATAAAAAAKGNDNRKQTVNFVSFAPLPGQDPEECQKHLKQVQNLLSAKKAEEEEEENGDL